MDVLKGKDIHGHAFRHRFDFDWYIGGSLINMYANSARIEDSCTVFNLLPQRDDISRNSILAGCVQNGRFDEGKQLHGYIIRGGFDDNMFIARSLVDIHAGLTDEAWMYFNCMSKNHGITPGLEHYAAMADLLGHAGKVHKNLELAEKVVKEIFKVDLENVGAYVLMSNIYAAARRWKDRAKMRITMKRKGIIKEPACSWIEV
ncbi:hypothetical protein DITRI_Ditri06bG0117300 [Diplodiscus trichospermus]